MTIVFASNNKHKVKEIKSILGDSFTLLDLSDLNITEDIPENEPDLDGNALAKARYVHSATGMKERQEFTMALTKFTRYRLQSGFLKNTKAKKLNNLPRKYLTYELPGI